jgi:hypothetical protein
MLRERQIMNLLSGSCLIALLTLSGLQASQPKKIATTEANKHIGETVTVCGKVVGTRTSKYEVPGRGRPTFLDLDVPEPKPLFLIVTWPSDSTKPGQLEDYQEKQVCVTGKIVKARGVPQIIATDPSQIKSQASENK